MNLNYALFFVVAALPCGAMLHRVRRPQDMHSSEPAQYGFDEEGMNKSVSSGDDFYTYANGRYIAATKIPADKTRWGPFDQLGDAALSHVRTILEEDSGKIGSFYKSFMDEPTIAAKGLEPIQKVLSAVKGMKDLVAFSKLAGKSVSTISPSPFQVMVDVDPKDSFKYSVILNAGGLGLPTRDYYILESKQSIKDAYKAYIAKALEMLEWPNPEQASDDILALEESFANVHWPREDLRDPLKTYNLRTQAQVAKEAPGFDWEVFFEQCGNLSGRKIIVSTPSTVTGMAQIISKTNVSILQAWSAVQLFTSVAAYLPQQFTDVYFNFYGKTLSGQQEESPRWKRGVNLLNHHMGEAVAEVFVQKYFPPEAKERVEAMTMQLKSAFQSRLTKLSWMTNATKQKALKKLANFDIQVGYPKKFKSYATLEVIDDDLLGNLQRSISRLWKIDLARLDKPVDRDEWFMLPQTINAYANPQFNQIVFPAAILQPPFFNAAADHSVNFGAIGAVIGHEMTHGFDDEGRHYDDQGKLFDWWTPEDEAEFNERAERYGKQFSNFDLGPMANGSHINARLTLGEDIADLGGLSLAFDAFTASRDVANLTDDAVQEGNRRVFLGWAQLWRTVVRPEALQASLASDPHPPAQARVNIPTRNIDAWYEAFSVGEGSKSYLPPRQRVTIW